MDKKNLQLPTIDEAGVIALGLCEHLTAREQSMFVAGFQEAIKFLMYNAEFRELKTRVLEEYKKYYWYVNSCLDVAKSADIGRCTDRERYNAGNYKETYEEAVKLRDMLREHAQDPETGYVDGYYVKKYTEELGFSIGYMERSNIEAREQITHKLGFGSGSTEFLMAQLRLEQAYRNNMCNTCLESVIWVTGTFGTVRKYNVDPENFSKELGGLGFEYYKLIKGRAPEGSEYFYLDSGFNICTKPDARLPGEDDKHKAGNYRRNRRDIEKLQAKFMEASRKAKEPEDEDSDYINNITVYFGDSDSETVFWHSYLGTVDIPGRGM